jgi:hypothetical protein
VAGLAPVDLGEDAPAVGLVIEVSQQEDGLGDAADLGERSSEGAGATSGVEDPQQLRRPHRAGEQRSCHPEEVVPVGGDEAGIDAMASDGVEGAVAGVALKPPEPGGADVGQAGAELIAQKLEQPEPGRSRTPSRS